MAYLDFLPPDRYPTTYVRDTFPESHWSFEWPRHKVADAIHDFIHPFEQDVRTPHADIRETTEKYYIDIELPGLANMDGFSVKWTNPRTLLVEAQIMRPNIEGSDLLSKNESSKGGLDKDLPGGVHFLARERRVGVFARAFHFSVEINQDEMQADMQYGLLRLVVPKVHDKEPVRQVEVKQAANS
ncbi:hypothetical protein BX600DRAFT_477426 [Xylariales sp. PMI_506]|nr:hypothetical protein BX600DRAFT_477426 [Xylariales sp. PMI_506]